jgi:hypothetical protein
MRWAWLGFAWLGLGQFKGGASGPSAYVVKVTSDQLLASIFFSVSCCWQLFWMVYDLDWMCLFSSNCWLQKI